MECEKLCKYKTLKIALSKIILNNDNSIFLSNMAHLINNIVIHLYQFIRLWILSKYTNNLPIPPITKKFICMAFRAILIEPARGRKVKNPYDHLNEFKLFFDNVYSPLNCPTKLNGLHIKHIINDSLATDILTNIENNIKMHFSKHVSRYVNIIFLKDKKRSKTLTNELNKLKNDLKKNTVTCDPKYHNWLLINRSKIIPDYEHSYEFDIQHNPQKYLKYMIYILNILGIMCNKCSDKEIKSLKKIIKNKPYKDIKIFTDNYPLPTLAQLYNKN